MNTKAHLTVEGLNKIRNIKAGMNKGRYLNTENLENENSCRPTASVNNIGMPSGQISYRQERKYSSKTCYNDNILKGYVEKMQDPSYRRGFDDGVNLLNDVFNVVIPLFKEHSLLGVKGKEFADFCTIAELIKNKAHLTASGLEEIVRIKSGMNQGKYLSLNTENVDSKKSMAESLVSPKGSNLYEDGSINKQPYLVSANDTYMLQGLKISEFAPYLAGLIPSLSQKKWYSTNTNSHRSTLDEKIYLHPYFVTGFSDAESCFSLRIMQNSKVKVGWRVLCSFEIHLHKKDLSILQKIQSFLGLGNISLKANGSCSYSVGSITDLVVIINHFDKYPLITNKYADYILFKAAVNLVQNNEHLTIDGLRKIVALKASINKLYNKVRIFQILFLYLDQIF
jgi:hypothetical protein